MATLFRSFCSPSSSDILHGSFAPPSLPQRLCRHRLASLMTSSQRLQLFSSPAAIPLSPTFVSARCMSGSSSAAQIEDLVKSRNAQNPVVVYSKTWCPYCGRVKSLFNELGVNASIVELDELADEAEVQSALQRLTGQSTVPNVFIGGEHIGGCDDTMALHQSGKLLSLLKSAGAKFS